MLSSAVFLQESITASKVVALIAALIGVTLVVVGDDVTVTGSGVVLVGIASL